MYRYFRITKLSERGVAVDQTIVYAPDLRTAFDLSRSRWPAGALRCDGSGEAL